MIVIIDSVPIDLMKLEVLATRFSDTSIIEKFLSCVDAQTYLMNNKCEFITININALTEKSARDFLGLLLNYQAEAQIFLGIKDEADKDLPIVKKIGEKFKINWFFKPISIQAVSTLFYSFNKQKINENNSLEKHYLPLKIDLFKKNLHAPCDIYIQLSGSKVVKICNSKDAFFNPEKFIDFKKKGIKKLFITQSDFNAYGDHFFSTKVLSGTQNIPNEYQTLDIAESALNFCVELGINKEVVELIMDNMESVLADKKVVELRNFFQLYQSQKDSFLYFHSYLTSIFATLICNQMTWDSSIIRKNLYLAAILHDLEIKNDNFLKLHSAIEDLENIKTLSAEDQKALLFHPHKMSERLSNIHEIPSDVLSIISKHHEGKGNKSYPLKIMAPSLPPINCLFNTAHEFAILLLKAEFNISELDEIFHKLRETYPAQNFKVMIDGLAKGLKI
jgi:HD-GYP domain-containing protein (c-di-GMP phosphodiesterase class II)